MQIVVNEALKAYIDPLTPEEHQALERSILAEGCRDALVLWGDVLVDGHNRYGICQQHGLPFSTVQATQFHSMDDVHLWMIDQHLGRRSISDFQRGVLALRKRDIIETRLKHAAETRAAAVMADDGQAADSATDADTEASAPPIDAQVVLSRDALAKAARISSSQVRMIEAIQAQATPEVVAAVKAGELSLNAAAAVASLPAEEQVQAAHGGTKELKEAAKRVREAKRKPKADGPASDTSANPESESSAMDEQALRHRVTELEAENAQLRAQILQLQALLPDAAPF